MFQVSVDIKSAQNAIDQYLSSQENHIKYVSGKLNKAVNNSLIFTSKNSGAFGNISRNKQVRAIDKIKNTTHHSNLGKITDIILYSWYEAHVLIPNKITTSHNSKNIKTDKTLYKDLTNTDESLNSINNDKSYTNHITNNSNYCTKGNDLKHHQKCIYTDSNVYLEECRIDKLPPLSLPNKHIDLDKLYLYSKNDSEKNDETSNDNITFKLPGSNSQSINELRHNHTNVDTNQRYGCKTNESLIIPSLKSFISHKSFSVYEENVKFGGWPTHSNEMELGVWVYTTPFLEHCSIDIPTLYLCQVQHMNKKMFKDAEPSRITMWCKRYNYESPDFINTDSEDEDENDCEYKERSDFSNPFADIERNVDDVNKLEVAGLYRNLALSSSTFVAPCNGYYLKINGETVEELEVTFMRNKINRLYNKHRRHNLLRSIFSRIRNISPKQGLLSPFPPEKILRLSKSGVHGFGLFAGEEIKKGEFIIEYAGVLITDAMTDVREDAYEKNMGSSTYLFRADDNRIIDATKTGNLARFVNHSCDPNAFTNTIHDEHNGPHVGIYASKNIALGQEIFYNYRLSESVSNKEFCHCGSSNCSGKI